MNILAIETSCDETASAVVSDGTYVVSNAVASSTDIHKTWGGIVPELAAREQLAYMIPVLLKAMEPFMAHGDGLKTAIEKHIDALAVTVGPGLIGSLLIGTETAKTLAFATGKPLIPVNHVQAHMYANFIGGKEIAFPAISLVASGGHTELFLMKSARELTWLGGTIDDAAGEAFDKTARLLGFGGGGGRAIEEASCQFKVQSAGRRTKSKVILPRPMINDGTLNFSFSGLKTAVMREFRKLKSPTFADTAAFSYEVQEAICDVLVKKTMSAAYSTGARSILLSGGVAANKRLREKFQKAVTGVNPPVAFHVPPIELCTDNAVYIASYAFFRGKPVGWQTVHAAPDLSVET